MPDEVCKPGSSPTSLQGPSGHGWMTLAKWCCPLRAATRRFPGRKLLRLSIVAARTATKTGGDPNTVMRNGLLRTQNTGLLE